LALILNSADFAIPDGIGLAQANLFLSLPNYSFLPLRFLALIFQLMLQEDKTTYRI
jgi:hypothetical protein